MSRAVLVALAVWLMAGVPRAPEGGAERVGEVWRVAAEGRGVPAAAGASVYFLGTRHEVVAVAAASGLVRWRTGTGRASSGEGTQGSRVLVSQGVIVTGDYDLLGLDAVTGALRWRFAPQDGYGAGIYLGVADQGVVFAGSAAGRLYAVTVSEGRLIWSVAVAAAAASTVFQPAADHEVVAAGYTVFGVPAAGGVVVVERASGQVRWRREFPGGAAGAATGFAGGPVLAGGLVIAASSDGRIYGFDRATGHIRWSAGAVTRADGRIQEQDWRGLARSGLLVVAGSLSGVLTAFDAASGRPRWRFQQPEGGSIAVQITADDRRVYVPYFSGLLVAVDTRDGRQQWKTGGFNDGFSWAPALSDGRVYAAGSHAGLVAFTR